MLKNFRGGGEIALLVASLSTPLISSNINNKKVSVTSSSNEGYQEAPISEFFTGDDLSGNIFYTEDAGNIILSGLDPDGTAPTNYLSSGTNLQLKISLFDGKPIDCFDYFWGSVASTEMSAKVMDLQGTLDLSLATKFTRAGDSDTPCFAGQSKLTNIIFPSSIATVSGFALTGCTQLTSIAFYREDPEWMEWNDSLGTGIKPNFIDAYTNDNVIGETIWGACPLQTIYVPDDKVEAYHTYATTTSTTCKEWFNDSTMTFKGLSEMPGATTPTNSNLELILGLSLGLGIPVVAGTITGIVVGVKKHQNKGKKK